MSQPHNRVSLFFFVRVGFFLPDGSSLGRSCFARVCFFQRMGHLADVAPGLLHWMARARAAFAKRVVKRARAFDGQLRSGGREMSPSLPEVLSEKQKRRVGANPRKRD